MHSPVQSLVGTACLREAQAVTIARRMTRLGDWTGELLALLAVAVASLSQTLENVGNYQLHALAETDAPF